MKKIFMVLFAVVLGFTAMASLISGPLSEPSNGNSVFSPEVCQFSLTSYSGTVNSSGNTAQFQVGLSCPQEKDVRATVVVYIDGNLVASKVVTVSAGKDYSEKVTISVGGQYNGKTYNLGVQ